MKAKSKLFEYFLNKLDLELHPWITEEIKTEHELIDYYENNILIQHESDFDRPED